MDPKYIEAAKKILIVVSDYSGDTITQEEMKEASMAFAKIIQIMHEIE